MRFFCAICFSFGALFSEIVEVDSLDKAKIYFQKLDSDDLALFDVDFTLLVPDDAILQPKGTEIISVTKRLKPDLHSQLILSAKSSLVEKSLLPLIHDLQDRNVKTLAFTALMTGKYGKIENLADFRIEELKSFGFNFQNAFPNVKTIYFQKEAHKEQPPLYKSGILFSAKHPKGDILKQFLRAIDFYPSKVVFVDDQIQYLNSVESAMKEMGIAFVGIYYTAAKKLPAPNENIAELQFRHLEDHGVWLNDEEARRR